MFAPQPLAGNGLAVFSDAAGLRPRFMLQLTQELRQFESIFLTTLEQPDVFDARVFTVEEELPFAGHPALGAAAVLHEKKTDEDIEVRLNFSSGQTTLYSQRIGKGAYRVEMNQGNPIFSRELARNEEALFLDALGLSPQDRLTGLPLAVVSTGLPYLIVPVTSAALAQAHIKFTDFEARLETVNAKFVYVFDVEGSEGRTWDNRGAVEDIATGSAAGPMGAYLVRYGLERPNSWRVIHQGRFTGRPSEILVCVKNAGTGSEEVIVAGNVHMVGSGMIEASLLTMSKLEG